MATEETFLKSVASQMTNEALAQRLESIRTQPRSWSRPERDAFLAEASARLGEDEWVP